MMSGQASDDRSQVLGGDEPLGWHDLPMHAAHLHGDIPLWDRMFGTYRDTTVFAERCGFPEGAEQRLGAMLAFVDVYDEG
jgi:hypothetical protein